MPDVHYAIELQHSGDVAATLEENMLLGCYSSSQERTPKCATADETCFPSIMQLSSHATAVALTSEGGPFFLTSNCTDNPSARLFN